MKPLIRLSLLLLIAIATFTSCKKSSPKQTKFIPKEASFVATINTKSLQDKLIKSQATLENLLKSITNSSDTALDRGKKEWEELKNSGIDLDENIYFSLVQKGGGMMDIQSMGAGRAAVFSAVGGLKDAAKFEAYVKKKDASLQIQKEKDYTYVSKDSNMVAWGKDVIIFMSYNEPSVMDMRMDSSANPELVRPVKSESPADIKAEMSSYFNLDEDQSMASIAEFRDLTAQNADGSLWMNSAASLADMPIPLPKMQQLLENSYTAATVDFEEGKIVMDSKTYSSKAMSDILEEHSGSTVNLDMVRNYPSNNIAGFFIASFNPEFVNGVVKFLEVGGFVDGFIKKTLGENYTLQDILKSVKGDMAVIVSDVKLRGMDSATKVNELREGKDLSGLNSPKVLVNIPVGDKAQFNRLMDKLVEQQMMRKVNNEYALAPALSSAGFKVSIDDKNFLIASDSMVISQYKAGTAKSNIDAALLDGFKGKSSAGFIDLESIINSTVPNATNSESLTSAKATFKNIWGYTENFNGKHIEGRLEINMKDEKENSLTSLLKFMSVASNEIQKHRKVSKWSSDDAKADSVRGSVE